MKYIKLETFLYVRGLYSTSRIRRWGLAIRHTLGHFYA